MKENKQEGIFDGGLKKSRLLYGYDPDHHYNLLASEFPQEKPLASRAT